MTDKGDGMEHQHREQSGNGQAGLSSGYTEDINSEMAPGSPQPIDNTFANIRQRYVSASGHTRLLTATRYGKLYMLKCLKPDFLYTPESSVFLQYVGDNSIPHGGLLAYMAPATFPDPDLEPQNQSSFEIGTDLRFFNGRIRLDATYYYNKTTKNIVRLDVANSTGFFYMRKNAGTITNEGVEILAGFTPVKTKNFSWDLDVNFASNRQLVERLKEAGLQFSRSEEDLSGYTDKLSGQSIVISGVFQHHSRDEYKALIEKNGGKNSGSISSKTSFILAGDNMGPAKLEKAQKLGIRIMNEDEFLELIS